MMKKLFSVLVAVLLLQILPFKAEAVKYACGEDAQSGKSAKFVIVGEDAVNFREAPEGKIIRAYDQHTLLRVIKDRGQWLLVESAGGRGYIFKSKTAPISQEALVEEDFALPFSDLNAPFDEEALIGFLGQPAENNKVSNRKYLDFENIQLVGDEKGYLVEVISRDSKLATIRGIAVGDAENRVVGQYGAPANVDYSINATIYTYYYQLTKEYLFSMAFAINGAGRVETITWNVVEKPKNEKRAKIVKKEKKY